jgi:formate hydrogenlyase subunit 6/NADH:ubiquinone oxidoreductase subunit I
MTNAHQPDTWVLPKLRLDDLIRLLLQDGFEVIGPRIEQQAIVYGPVQSASNLPVGWTDHQAPGSYRLEERQDDAYFGYAVGPHSWKKYLFPPTLRLWEARRTDVGFAVHEAMPDPPRRAILGVRACELHAIAVQDKVFLDRRGQFTDPHYARARERLFLVAVECEHPGGTCFCASMGTGPEINEAPQEGGGKGGKGDIDVAPPSGRQSLPLAPHPSASTRPAFFDLALTELDEAFVVRVGSVAGQDVLDRLGLMTAPQEQVDEAGRRVATATAAMGRSLDVTDIRNLLHRNQEHPRWDDVAGRCLSCTNCTLVCPTCFCSGVEDVTDLGVENAERVRRWDSCFNPEFAQVHGGNFRASIRGRYRQWLTHKFASWHDQFDVSGCVGCGRCITWCPVGIDVTQEIAAIRATDGQREGSSL